MITVTQLESGEVKLPNEIFEPVFEHPKTPVDHLTGNRLMAFRGQQTGTYLEPAFEDVLEIPCAGAEN